MSHKYKVFFKFSAHYHTRQVEVVGDFNRWKPEQLVLEDEDGDNIWWGWTRLPSGRYEYKYLVDGVEYKLDPFKPTVQNGDFVNNVLLIGEAKLKGDFLHSHEEIDFYSDHVFYIRATINHLKYRHANLIVMVDDVPHTLHGIEVYKDEVYLYLMFKVNHTTSARELLYYFELESLEGGISYYGRNGECREEWEIESYDYRNEETRKFLTPDWVKNAVFYQVFPDRFCNGDPALNPPSIADRNTPPDSDVFYGGDLVGVTAKVDYFKRLGVNSLYFNPIFESPSAHKYDTADYLKIDSHFGNDEIFDQMVLKLREKSIRFILDGVFNHTGDQFWAFRDIVEKEDESAYKEWYFIKDYPVLAENALNYECWWNFKIHPKLNEKNLEVCNYLLKVARHWIERGASGWRLDVPSELSHAFWKAFRKEVKGVSQDTFVVGEIWQKSSEWLQGDEFDSVMNYRFRDAVVEFFGQRRITPNEFEKQIGEQLFDNPMQANFAMLNLLGSHDTARFLTVAEGQVERLKLASAFQFTYIGAPMIYYGDEIGLEGGKDPDNRRPMIWDEYYWNKDLFEHYQNLIQLRKANTVLRTGDLRFFHVKENIIGFERFDDQDSLFVMLNNSEDNITVDVTKFAGNGDFVDLSKQYSLKRKRAYTLYANDFAILRKIRER